MKTGEIKKDKFKYKTVKKNQTHLINSQDVDICCMPVFGVEELDILQVSLILNELLAPLDELLRFNENNFLFIFGEFGPLGGPSGNNPMDFLFPKFFKLSFNYAGSSARELQHNQKLIFT